MTGRSEKPAYPSRHSRKSRYSGGPALPDAYIPISSASDAPQEEFSQEPVCIELAQEHGPAPVALNLSSDDDEDIYVCGADALLLAEQQEKELRAFRSALQESARPEIALSAISSALHSLGTPLFGTETEAYPPCPDIEAVPKLKGAAIGRAKIDARLVSFLACCAVAPYESSPAREKAHEGEGSTASGDNPWITVRPSLDARHVPTPPPPEQKGSAFVLAVSQKYTGKGIADRVKRLLLWVALAVVFAFFLGKGCSF